MIYNYLPVSDKSLIQSTLQNIETSSEVTKRFLVLKLFFKTLGEAILHAGTALVKLTFTAVQLPLSACNKAPIPFCVALGDTRDHAIRAAKLVAASILVPLPALVSPTFAIRSYKWLKLTDESSPDSPTLSLGQRCQQLYQRLITSRSFKPSLVVAGIVVSLVALGIVYTYSSPLAIVFSLTKPHIQEISSFSNMTCPINQTNLLNPINGTVPDPAISIGLASLMGFGLTGAALLTCVVGAVACYSRKKAKAPSKDQPLSVETHPLKWEEKAESLPSNVELQNIEKALRRESVYIKISSSGEATLSKLYEVSNLDIRSLNRGQILSLIIESIDREFYDLANYLLTLNWRPAEKCLKIHPQQLLNLIKKHGFNKNIKDLVISNRNIDQTVNSVKFNTDKDVSIYQELSKYGYKADVGLLRNVLFSHKYPFLDVILESLDEEWLHEHARGLLDILKQTEDPLFMELIRNRFPTIESHCSLDLLQQAIRSRKQDFVHMILNSGFKLTQEQFEEGGLFDLALETSNLKLIQDLSSYADRLKIPHPSYLERLGLSKRNGEGALRKKLFRYAMFSPLSNIYQLARTYPHLYPILPWVTERISLLVRFPSLEQAEGVHAQYSDNATYLQSSQEYAEENLAFLNTSLPTLTNFSRDEFLTGITSNRFARMKNKDNNYITRQIDKPQTLQTRLFDRKTVELVDGWTDVSIPGRYHWSHRHLVKLLFNRNEKCWIDHPYIKSTTDDKTFTYVIPETGVEQSITRLSLYYWEHPSGDTFQQFLEHLKTLHQEILDYQLDVRNPKNKDLFFEKVARAYWLMSTLCEMHRGTPHNVMIWLNAIYRHHQLPYPIPNRDSFFLDNTMLMLPFNEAIKNWHTFLEPTLDQALTFGSESEKINYFKRLLKKHPQLTVLCSPEFRLQLFRKKAPIGLVSSSPLSAPPPSSSATSSSGNLSPEQTTRLAHLEHDVQNNSRLEGTEYKELRALRALRDSVTSEPLH